MAPWDARGLEGTQAERSIIVFRIGWDIYYIYTYIAVLASQSHCRRSLYRRFVATVKDCSNVRLPILDLSDTFQVKSSSNTPVMQRTRRVRKQDGGMLTQYFARSLSLWTSRRLGSAPVRLACIQRGPKRGLVLVCPG